MAHDTKDGAATILFNISAVERETGLSKDTLRVWERRYDFPHPVRDDNGDRAYTTGQIAKLRLIKRLLDQGHRPGKIIGLDDEHLERLVTEPAGDQPPRQDIAVYIRLVRSHQALELRRHLSQAMARQGLQKFVVDTVAPLTRAVGEAWMRGEIAVFEEHLYTELMEGLLRNAITALQPQGNAPRVLLTSLPNEPHNLGLLMVEAMLTVENALCIPLGTETPVTEIAQAAQAHRVDMVALSFSSAYPESKAIDALRELRSLLPDSTLLCAGGAGIARIRRRLDGIQLIIELEKMCELVRQWRAEHSSY
ncbi:MAG: MerR family transcriptional regulator [Betaproteobacteria bacterium]|nr:MAG: MerR family transcriptional regulator [Betaproteobacteria bacterium]